MNKKGIITHPVFAYSVAFVIGVVLMILLCRGVIEIGGLGKLVCG